MNKYIGARTRSTTTYVSAVLLLVSTIGGGCSRSSGNEGASPVAPLGHVNVQQDGRFPEIILDINRPSLIAFTPDRRLYADLLLYMDYRTIQSLSGATIKAILFDSELNLVWSVDAPVLLSPKRHDHWTTFSNDSGLMCSLARPNGMKFAKQEGGETRILSAGKTSYLLICVKSESLTEPIKLRPRLFFSGGKGGDY